MVFALIVVIGIIMYRVVEVSGASRDVLSDGMGDRGLASPGEPIQPGWGAYWNIWTTNLSHLRRPPRSL